MTMKSLLLLALALPSLVTAQEAPPAAACQAMDASLPVALAAWRNPSPASGPLRPGMAVQVPLRPVAELQVAVAPHTPRDGGATTGARLDLDIATPGTFQIALDHAVWIDLVRDGQTVRSAANGRGPACSSIHKIVDFALTPGRYVIQLSGTNAASARLLVIPR
jgi:hypothetical protein